MSNHANGDVRMLRVRWGVREHNQPSTARAGRTLVHSDDVTVSRSEIHRIAYSHGSGSRWIAIGILSRFGEGPDGNHLKFERLCVTEQFWLQSQSTLARRRVLAGTPQIRIDSNSWGNSWYQELVSRLWGCRVWPAFPTFRRRVSSDSERESTRDRLRRDEPRGGAISGRDVCQRYSRHWQIETEYKSIKGDFLARTFSKEYRVRLFYFVFVVLLYNIWRLTDFLLKAEVDGKIDYPPVLTAGECVEWVSSALIPPD